MSLCFQRERTHANETPNAGPQAVVGQLSPTAGVGNGPVVEYAAQEVNEYRNQEDEPEDAAGADTTGLVWLSMGARMA